MPLTFLTFCPSLLWMLETFGPSLSRTFKTLGPSLSNTSGKGLRCWLGGSGNVALNVTEDCSASLTQSRLRCSVCTFAFGVFDGSPKLGWKVAGWSFPVMLLFVQVEVLVGLT